MIKLLAGGRRMKTSGLTALALILAGPAAPLSAADAPTEVRLRALEAQLRAVQRKVFPDGAGKTFVPEITPAQAGQTAAGGTATTTPITDLQARLDSVEAQIKRLTALAEENSNRLAQLEARVNGTAPVAAPTPAAVTPSAVTTTAVAAPAPVPAAAATTAATTPVVPAIPVPTPAPTPTPVPTPTPTAANSNLAAMTSGASAPKPKPAAAAGPSAQRLAAVRAILKPQTEDPGDDEYSYGFRLWEAKFYPEAQQQLKMMIDKYPRHTRVSYARNLLGRSYLDDAKPRDAATWFLQNYQANKTGERAPDSLLYLAESMRLLDDSKRACIALAEFATNFPREAAGRLKAQYDATRSGVKCN
jgi:TolA-binding protein